MSARRASLWRRCWWWVRGGPARLGAATRRREAAVRRRRAAASPDTWECRAAVHEAGHAIAAWYCTAVTEARGARIDLPDGGMVLHRIYASDPEHHWCYLVIKLAGVAAEEVVYGRWRSGGSADDLLVARDLIGRIGSSAPPFDVEPSRLPIERAFAVALDAREVAAIRQAHAMAKRIVEAHLGQLYQLVGALLHLRHMLEPDLAAVLGHRSFVRVVGLFGKSKFFLPATR